MSYQRNAGAARAFGLAVKIATGLQKLAGKLTPPPFRLLQIGSAFWQSRALYAAAKLDMATALGDGELEAAAVAARIGADPQATARLLRFLASLGVFEETGPQRYRNNGVSAYLRADKPGNLRAMTLMHNSAAMTRPWIEDLERGVREGVPPFVLAHGEELFGYLDRHADFDALFSEAMESVESLTGDSFATDFDWSRFRRLIDVGGSRGAKALAILNRHPQLTALVVDRPQVVAEAEHHRAAHPAAGAERMSFQAGDLFGEIPPARDDRDIYFLCAVLHGFADEACVSALKNLARAVGTTGAPIALLELVMPKTGADPAGAAFDMQMFMGTRGRERTLAEWQTLFAGAGLALEEQVGLRAFGSILVLRPAPPKP